MKNTHVTFYFLLAAVVVSSCQSKERKSGLEIQDTIPVKVMKIEQSGSTENILATGVFSTDDETLLGFKNGGVISSIQVKEGDAIRKGQLLASVHSSEIDAKAGQVNLAVEKARRDFERAQKLYADSVATLEQLENAKTAYEVAQQDIKSVNFNQQYSNIYAPSSGYVLAKLANVGQVVGPGTPVLQVNGAAKGIWYLKVGVSDEQWARIQVGNSAKITTDAYPQDSLIAQVSKKSEAIDPQSGTFTIYLGIVNAGNYKLASGVFGRAEIQSTSKNESSLWAIPYAALMNADGNTGYVFITDDQKSVKKKKVQIAKITDQEVLIKAGLEGVHSLVSSGSPYLKDGSFIKIIK